MIYFIGAGPGDPELLTVKGVRLLKEADLVIYAGSLVNPELLKYTSADCEIYNSAAMDLSEMVQIMVEGERSGKKVVRLHTGDPAIYGAIQEQMWKLEQVGIEYQVVPGVSSFSGATAALKRELTIPGKVQTVILTRLEGRTPVAERENLASLASHQSSLVIFLSVGLIEQVVRELSTAYPLNTPVAVVYKATWPEEQIIRGTLENICQLVTEAEIRRTALILVGDFLRSERTEESMLYASHFTHGFKQGCSDQVTD